MKTEHVISAGFGVNAGVGARRDMTEDVKMRTHYVVEAYRKGKLLWKEEFENLVTTVGKNKLLDATFKTGLTSPAWYVGLKNTGTALAADTSASHGSWTENTTYSEGTRQAFTPGTISAGSVDNSASKAVFTISGTTTIYGCFTIDNSTKGGSTGTLYGVGDFSSSRALEAADTLNVTVTKTAS